MAMDREASSQRDRSATIDALLAALQTHDVATHRATALRRQAALVFERAHAPEVSPSERLRQRFAQLYHGAVEPILVAAVVVLYLGWAFRQAAAILG